MPGVLLTAALLFASGETDSYLGPSVVGHWEPAPIVLPIYLKPNDTINVGTSGAALPLAIVRNGFRCTYGFGVVLDRNPDEDVFGPRVRDRK